MRKIGDWAFSGCRSLESIEIPEGVREIGASAFRECRSLERIEIPDGVTKIRENAFDGTKWMKQYEGDYVIVNNILICYKGRDKYVKIPDGVRSIGECVF